MRSDVDGSQSPYRAQAREALAVAIGLWPLIVLVGLAGGLLYIAGMSGNPY